MKKKFPDWSILTAVAFHMVAAALLTTLPAGCSIGTMVQSVWMALQQ